jgi:hypothetical protein
MSNVLIDKPERLKVDRQTPAARQPHEPHAPRRVRRLSLLSSETAGPALKQAFIMLRPDIQWKNPVMFVVEVGAFLTLLYVIKAALGHPDSQVSLSYFIALDAWLFLTVLFANFATGLAEARGKAQADSLRRTRRDTLAYRLRSGGAIDEVSSMDLKPGDLVVVKAGQTVPGDARSWRASPQSMSLRLPVSRLQSYANRAGTGPVRPEVLGLSRIGSLSRLPSAPANRFSTA